MSKNKQTIVFMAYSLGAGIMLANATNNLWYGFALVLTLESIFHAVTWGR